MAESTGDAAHGAAASAVKPRKCAASWLLFAVPRALW